MNSPAGHPGSGRRGREGWIVAVDVGGTFTDAVAISGEGRLFVAKVQSTPTEPAVGLTNAVRELAELGVPLDRVRSLFHGTTVATNATITGRLARAALLTTEGYRDVLGYRTGARPRLYDLEQPRPTELVARRDRIEVHERVAWNGQVMTPLTDEEIERVVEEVARRAPEAVGICLLFSYMNDEHERRLGDALARRLPDAPVTLSSAVAREFREYPRTATTALNASLRPLVGRYLLGAQVSLRQLGMRQPFLIMQSNGGSVPADRADREAHRLLLSGPTAGVAATIALGARHGMDRLIALDMGGTSLDVCLIREGVPPVRPMEEVDNHPILAPSVDLVTVGAGGGSIASVDAAGRLRVGPESAGADPGPAVYGHGGKQATLTDAHAVVGSLGVETPLAGRLALDVDAGREAVARVARDMGLGIDEAGEGIIAVATAHVIRALRRVSVERGVDPSEYALVAFGGAGPLHAGRLLRELRLGSVLVPSHPGLFSAAGLLAADLRIDESQTVLRLLDAEAADDLMAWYREAAKRITSQLVEDGISRSRIRLVPSADCRYLGQGFELSVPLQSMGRTGLRRLAADFHELHARTYGHVAREEAIELATLRLSGFGAMTRPDPSPVARGSREPSRRAAVGRRELLLPGSRRRRSVPILARDRLRAGNRIGGPAVVEEMDSTTLLLPGQEARVDREGNLWIREEGRQMRDVRRSARGGAAARGSDRRASRRLDPITYELIHAQLLSAAEEMGAILKRSSFSPIIREMNDFSCALFDGEGHLVAQADYIPAQLGAMSLAVQSTLERWRDELEPGDVFIANHPYMGCMHTPDINILMPVFLSGRLFAWTGSTAHHVDVGGVNPGTEGADLRQMYAEGLILPPVRLARSGSEDPDLVAIIRNNVRDPITTVADLRAQRAACDLGRQRLEETVEGYGRDAVATAFEMALDHVERTARVALADLPDGEGEAEGFLDDDGVGGPPTRIHARLSKQGDKLSVDLSGSAAQIPGALNVPWASTRAAVVYLLRAVTDPRMTTNDGILRTVDILCPRGRVLNPNPPAAVSVRHNTCQRLAETLVRAASAIWPEKAVASGTVTFFDVNLDSVSPKTSRASVMMDVVGGGTGGHRDGDGLDGVDTYMSNVALLPTEVAETEYAVRILRTELVPGSQGLGEHHGGLGIRREYEVLNFPQVATVYGEQTDPRFPPRGVLGGTDGSSTRIAIFGPDGEQLDVPRKATLELAPGSVIRVETSGGGGYGKLADRDPGLRQQDQEDGRVLPD